MKVKIREKAGLVTQVCKSSCSGGCSRRVIIQGLSTLTVITNCSDPKASLPNLLRPYQKIQSKLRAGEIAQVVESTGLACANP